MTINNDLSLNTLIVSGVVALIGWALKGVAKALIDALKLGIAHIAKLIGRIDTFETKLNDLADKVGDTQKLRADLNSYYKRIRDLEERLYDAKKVN